MVDEADVIATLPTVARLARSYARLLPPQVELADVVQAGAVGLLQAARRYDPARGASFRTFAGRRILGAMRDHGRTMDSLTRHQRRRWQSDDVVDVQLDWLGPGRFAAEPSPARDVFALDRLRRFLPRLSRRERVVVVASYGHGRFQAEIGAYLGISESRVSQLRARGLGRLRRMFAEEAEAAEAAAGQGAEN